MKPKEPRYHPLVFAAFLLAVFILILPVQADIVFVSLRLGNKGEALLAIAGSLLLVALPLLIAERGTRRHPEKWKPRFLTRVTWGIVVLNIIFNAIALPFLGCSSIEGSFDKAKQYVGSTSPGEFEAGFFFKLIKPIYERKNSIPFLISKTRSEDPTDRILACMLLIELVDQVKLQPTPQGRAFIRDIQPVELLSQLESIEANSLSEIWAYWHATWKNMAMKHIE